MSSQRPHPFVSRATVAAGLSAGLLVFFAPTQEAPDPTSPEAVPEALAAEIEAMGPTLDAIVDEALRSSATYHRLARLVEAAPHRLSGSPGAAAAVEWARLEMEAIGFDEVRLEPCLVPRWVRGDIEHLSYSAPSHLAGRPLDILALGGSIPTPEGGIEGEVVRVTTISEMADRKDELKGKIVLLDRPFDATERNNFAAYGRAVGARTQGAINAAKAGALAVVVRSMASVIDDQPHTGAMRYDPRVPKIPACAVSTRGAEELAAALERGPVRLNLELNCENHEPVRSYNVVGDYYGREFPEEIVVVGGHLDGWDVGQGAHDDGAGCAHTLEPVRIFEELGIRPRRTVRCVMFMNEENGLEGARAYAATHADEMDKHVMALESDSGGYTPRGFSCNANDPALAILRKVAQHFADETADKVDGGGAGADISQMAPYGVPLVGFRPDDERYFSYHHTHGDTLDRVHPREINMGAGVISALTWSIAEMSEPLPRNL